MSKPINLENLYFAFHETDDGLSNGELSVACAIIDGPFWDRNGYWDDHSKAHQRVSLLGFSQFCQCEFGAPEGMSPDDARDLLIQHGAEENLAILGPEGPDNLGPFTGWTRPARTALTEAEREALRVKRVVTTPRVTKEAEKLSTEKLRVVLEEVVEKQTGEKIPAKLWLRTNKSKNSKGLVKRDFQVCHPAGIHSYGFVWTDPTDTSVVQIHCQIYCSQKFEYATRGLTTKIKFDFRYPPKPSAQGAEEAPVVAETAVPDPQENVSGAIPLKLKVNPLDCLPSLKTMIEYEYPDRADKAFLRVNNPRCWVKKDVLRLRDLAVVDGAPEDQLTHYRLVDESTALGFVLSYTAPKMDHNNICCGYAVGVWGPQERPNEWLDLLVMLNPEGTQILHVFAHID